MDFIGAWWNARNIPQNKQPVAIPSDSNDVSPDTNNDENSYVFVDLPTELEADWELGEKEKSGEKRAPNFRDVTPPLCGMEGSEGPANSRSNRETIASDPILRKQIDGIWGNDELDLEVPDKESYSYSAYNNTYSPSLECEHGTYNTEDTANRAAGLFDFTPTPGTPISEIESPSPPLRNFRFYDPDKQWPVFRLHSPINKTTTPSLVPMPPIKNYAYCGTRPPPFTTSNFNVDQTHAQHDQP